MGGCGAWTSPGIVGNVILGLPWNRSDLYGRPTHKLTEDITDLFLLLFTATHTVVYNYVINNAKSYNDDYFAMDYFNDSKSGSCSDKKSKEEELSYEVPKDTEEV